MGYKSKRTIWGVPLVHISEGHFEDGRYVRETAFGWIAIGDIAVGLVFAVGGFACGGIAVGGLSFGLLGVGGCAFGLLALAGLAFGVLALGGLSIGFHSAVGGLAIAKNFAIGGAVIAEHGNDRLAFEFFHERLWWSLQDSVTAYWWVILLTVAGLIFVGRRLFQELKEKKKADRY